MNGLPDSRIADFRREYGLDQLAERRSIWLAQLGGMIIPLPNFRWRREIIAAHDAHHIQTGYPPTFSGELLVAAWEVGSGCYTDWRARSLCLVLMVLGLFVQYHDTVAAFRRGLCVKADGNFVDGTVMDLDV